MMVLRIEVDITGWENSVLTRNVMSKFVTNDSGNVDTHL